MNEDIWNGNEERVYDDSPSALNTYVRVNGSDVALEAGKPFGPSIKAVARDAGLGKFRVYMNGSELKPAAAPDAIEEGMNLELRPYDVAG
jgi:hypothetical protein